ncbi:MAG TPA: pentapeptide repeat-containing protein, partial [Caulobacteraceae bacterium]
MPIVQSIDHSVLQDVLEAHWRFLARQPGGRRAVLAYVDLSACQLDRVNLSEAELTGCVFRNASLNGANLESAVLYGCDLGDADLRGANLARADLRGVCLVGANLAGANMAGCDLREGRIALQP